MKLLIHDLGVKDFKKLFPSVPRDLVVMSPEQDIHSCIGCFSCWIRTPAYCIIKDDYHLLGDVCSKVPEIVLVSKCYYGGFSPYVKNVIDRCIPYLLPFYEVRNNRIAHVSRYENRIYLNAHFYGEKITPEEEDIAHKLIDEITFQFNGSGSTVSFYHDKLPPKGIIL